MLSLLLISLWRDPEANPTVAFEQEDEGVATKYKNRSVAEQRSLDLSWDLLMQKRFRFLRSVICRNDTELGRFRQLVVNAVMATDLGKRLICMFHAIATQSVLLTPFVHIQYEQATKS